VTHRLTALAACLVLAAMVVTGCGKKEPGIPRGDARELVSLLRKAQSESDDPQQCDDLASTIDEIRAKVADLPKKTDADIRDSLEGGVANLKSTAQSQCEQTNTTPTTPDTTTIPTTPPPSETTPPPSETTPPPSETTPPPSETTPPTTPTPTTPPDTGGTGPGNGNGNGNGNAGGNGLGNGKKKGHGKKPKAHSAGKHKHKAHAKAGR
jgi:hypothetical protein